MPDTIPYDIKETGTGIITLTLSGRMDLERFGELIPLVDTIFDSYTPSRLSVDMTGVDYLDSSGALFIVRLEDEARARSVAFALSGLSREKMGILSLIDGESLATPSLATKERPTGIVAQLGAGTIQPSRMFMISYPSAES